MTEKRKSHGIALHRNPLPIVLAQRAKQNGFIKSEEEEKKSVVFHDFL